MFLLVVKSSGQYHQKIPNCSYKNLLLTRKKMQQISFSKSNKKWTINCLLCYLNLALLPIIIPLATKYAVTLIYDFYNLKIVSKSTKY